MYCFYSLVYYDIRFDFDLQSCTCPSEPFNNPCICHILPEGQFDLCLPMETRESFGCFCFRLWVILFLFLVVVGLQFGCSSFGQVRGLRVLSGHNLCSRDREVPFLLRARALGRLVTRVSSRWDKVSHSVDVGWCVGGKGWGYRLPIPNNTSFT